MLYKILFSLHSFIAGIIGFSLVATLLGFANGPRLKQRDAILFILIFLFFAVTAYLAWWLKGQGKQTTATIMLVVVWLLLIFALIYAAGKARWN